MSQALTSQAVCKLVMSASSASAMDTTLDQYAAARGIAPMAVDAEERSGEKGKNGEKGNKGSSKGGSKKDSRKHSSDPGKGSNKGSSKGRSKSSHDVSDDEANEPGKGSTEGLYIHQSQRRAIQKALECQWAVKTEMCKFFLAGRCDRAHMCTFAHSEDEIRLKGQKPVGSVRRDW